MHYILSDNEKLSNCFLLTCLQNVILNVITEKYNYIHSKNILSDVIIFNALSFSFIFSHKIKETVRTMRTSESFVVLSFFPPIINTPLQICFRCPAGALCSPTDAGFCPSVSLLTTSEMSGHKRLLCTGDENKTTKKVFASFTSMA